MKEQHFGKLKALIESPVEKPTEALVLLHGVGSNEKNMIELGSMLSENRLIISLRAPLVMGPSAFAWFHVNFTAEGPIHNWNEASHSVLLLEEALSELSKQTDIPLSKIAVFGFSQGAIMTIGLALQSKLTLDRYVAASGRTLPEFKEFAAKSPLENYNERKIFVVHGEFDSKLPLSHAKNTEKVLREANLNLKYKEYKADHTVPQEVIHDVKAWLRTS